MAETKSRSGGIIPGNSWWGYAARFKSLPYFRLKNVIFHTRFQTRPLQSIPVFKPGLGAFWGTGCLHGGGGPQVGEVTRGGPPHLSRKRDQIKMRDYMDRRVTSLTWGPPPPCKQALRGSKSRDCTVPTLYDICRCRTA